MSRSVAVLRDRPKIAPPLRWLQHPVPPRVYVASLSDYNASRLHGQWIDAAQEPGEIITSMLSESRDPGAEEWAIHDFEDWLDLPRRVGVCLHHHPPRRRPGRARPPLRPVLTSGSDVAVHAACLLAALKVHRNGFARLLYSAM